MGTSQKNFQLAQTLDTPQHARTSADISISSLEQGEILHLEMLAEVLSCIQGLSELNFLLRGPNIIYLDLKKVLRDAIEHYTSPKSGGITPYLSCF